MSVQLKTVAERRLKFDYQKYYLSFAWKKAQVDPVCSMNKALPLKRCSQRVHCRLYFSPWGKRSTALNHRRDQLLAQCGRDLKVRIKQLQYFFIRDTNAVIYRGGRNFGLDRHCIRCLAQEATLLISIKTTSCPVREGKRRGPSINKSDLPVPPSEPSKKFTVIHALMPSSLPAIISTAFSPT